MAASLFTPFQLVNFVLSQALRATAIVPASDATASVPLCSGAYSSPEFQNVALTPNFMYLVAGICHFESSFNWQVYAGVASNGPGVGGSGTYISNYNAAVSLGAPGIVAPVAGASGNPYTEQQIQSLSSCPVLNMASRAQGLTQCLGTYHLANHEASSPFRLNAVSRGLIYPIYHPPFGNLGINALYQGPNYLAGAINGFVAMLTLMSQTNPVWQPWSTDGDGASLIATGHSLLSGGTVPQAQGAPGPLPAGSGSGSGSGGVPVFNTLSNGSNPSAC